MSQSEKLKRKEEKLKEKQKIMLLLKENIGTDIQKLKTVKHYFKHLELKNFNNTNNFCRMGKPIRKGKISPSYMPKDKISIPKERKVKISDIAHLPDADVIDFLIINLGFSEEQIKKAIELK